MGPRRTSSLSPEVLIAAYCRGLFPMADEDGAIYWYDPDPRAILPIDGFHVSRRLLRTVRRGRFRVQADTAFRKVVEGCAAPAPGREKTWISPEIAEAYTELYRLGFAHCVETWLGEELVGGVYGVAIRGLFAAESMFSRTTDASKVALVHLVERLRLGGFTLLDVQFVTPHLRRFGALEIPRTRYRALLAQALRVEAVF